MLLREFTICQEHTGFQQKRKQIFIVFDKIASSIGENEIIFGEASFW
jgi:hypothetical protein